MLARFAQCWGSLEASRGGMLEVIGAVGSRSGLHLAGQVVFLPSACGEVLKSGSRL